MTRIGIDFTPAYEQGAGIGRLVREQVFALATHDTATDYRLFVAGASEAQLPDPPGVNFRWKPTRITPTWLARVWHRARIRIPIELITGNLEIYHATDFVLPPTLKHTKTIVTVHDLSFVRVPEAASPGLRKYLNRVVPESVHRADHIIADSVATKQDLVDLYEVDPFKISVVLSAVDDSFSPVVDLARQSHTRQKYGIGQREYIFSIGTIQPRKNYGRLIESLSILRQQGYDIALVIAGGKGWLENPIYESVRRFQLEDNVIFTGFVDDEDLSTLYSTAICTAFPSLYEGFGFPVLESMACGTPVVTSNTSSLPEVAGDAAILVDPRSVEDIVNGLRRILDDSTLREQLIASGFEQVKSFTWSSSAEQLHNVYQSLLFT